MYMWSPHPVPSYYKKGLVHFSFSLLHSLYSATRETGQSSRATLFRHRHPIPSCLLLRFRERMAKSPAISSLLCYEGSTDFDDNSSMTDFDEDNSEGDWGEEKELDIPMTEDDEEHVKALLDKENHVGLPIVPEVVANGDWIKDARREAVKYIRSTSHRNGFRRQTAYMAIAYHDALLLNSRNGSEQQWTLRLAASVACLALASKYEETMAVSLWMFRTTHNYQILHKTELMVLNKLDWRMQILTPFAFTYYFLSKFSAHSQTSPSSSSLRDLTSKAESLFFDAVTEDEKVMRRNKPSTIAAAAALLIIDGNLSKEDMEFKINALSLNAYLNAEEIFSLYNELKRQREKRGTILDFSLPLENNNGDFLENSAVISARGAKRKSLTFSELTTHAKRSC